MNRRSFLQVSAGGAITLPEYHPKSTLRVAEHPVDRAKFPVIDVHTHLFSLGRKVDPASADSTELLRQIAAWMDQCNLQTLINLTGGTSETIPGILKAFTPFGGKFKTAAAPTWTRANEPATRNGKPMNWASVSGRRDRSENSETLAWSCATPPDIW
jgi:hypothetical protein